MNDRCRSRRWIVVILACATSGVAAACDADTALDPARRRAEVSASAVEIASPRDPVGSRPRIVILGDSLTAGLGLSLEESYPSRLQSILDANGYGFEVINAGVSGDTSAAGLRRLEWALDGDARVLVVALGANDGLRGVPPTETRKNLSEIVQHARARHIAVLLAGLEAPPNLGSVYTTKFRTVFQDVAREHDVVFLPFLLNGVAGNPELNQADGIHPTAEGARMIADLVWPVLRPMLNTSDSR